MRYIVDVMNGQTEIRQNCRTYLQSRHLTKQLKTDCSKYLREIGTLQKYYFFIFFIFESIADSVMHLRTFYNAQPIAKNICRTENLWNPLA